MFNFFNNLNWESSKHSDEENNRWSLLRAIEWGIWPAFLSIPIVPLFLTFFVWWKVIIVVISLTIFWSFIRYKYVNIKMAYYGVLLVQLKWIICPIVAIYLLTQSSSIAAVITLFWAFLAAYCGIFVGGTKIGFIQKMFMNKLGYSENK